MSVLFVGNGINQYAKIAPGWGELFAKSVGIKNYKTTDGVSATLEYELNVNKVLEQNPSMTAGDIKKNIAAFLKEKQKKATPEWEKMIHADLMNIAPEVILTPNYDYFLELSADPAFKAGAASTRMRLYSENRYRDVPGHRIYHVHGEISGPASICLGFEHYVGSIQFIRSKLTKNTKIRDLTGVTDPTAAEKRFHLYDVLKGLEKPEENCWYYYFFTEDMYILGFGLDAAEQDIWWLLNYRAQLMREFPGLIKNRIVYLETDSPCDCDPGEEILEKALQDVPTDDKKRKEALCETAMEIHKSLARKQTLQRKKETLEAFSVEVVDCYDDKGAKYDYKSRYEKALRVIKGGTKA